MNHSIKIWQLYPILVPLTIFTILIALVLIGVTITTNSVIGANITNATITTKVYVWNTEPDLYNVSISPAPIELTAGGAMVINCTGFFYDYNGWEDAINQSINATLYDTVSSSNNAVNDNNIHYTNSSCRSSCSVVGSTTTNGSCSCLFTVQYYANASSWVCNMTLTGGAGNATERQYLNFTDSMSAGSNINRLLAISIPTLIDYGNLTVTELSNLIAHNLTNTGNIPLNLSVRGYGGSLESIGGNQSMFCDSGNISIGYEKFSLNNISYINMNNLSSIDTPINLTISQRINDSEIELGRDRNQTFWAIQIPLSVGGYCNGTIVFTATSLT